MGLNIEIIHLPDGDEVVGPVIRCDHCHELIKNAEDGVYLYSGLYDKPNQIYFVHHNTRSPFRCHNAFEKEHPNPDRESGSWPWHMLDLFMVYLINNLNLDIKAAKKRASN